MPQDLPDWHAPEIDVTLHHVVDLGELVVRIGGIPSIDRGGNVLFQETFESGLVRWVTTLAGTGALVDLSPTEIRTNSFSARLVGGSDGAGSASIAHRMAPQEASKMGFECWFQLASAINRLHFQLEVYDGTNLTTYAVRWDDVNERVQYLDSAGAWVTKQSGVNLLALATLWHSAKLVVDLTTGRYQRLRLNEATYSLSGIQPLVAANATGPHLVLTVSLFSRAGQNDTIYLDDLIMTQNEPA